jgi:pyridoxal phosphate enzyme (YggS family)
MTTILANIAKVRQRIQHAAQACGRDVTDITLIAASKTKPAHLLVEAYNAGLLHFGENYAQEAESKWQSLQALPLIWHFIGPLQSNKTRAVAEHCHWLHSLDRLKIAERLHAQRPATLPPLNVCIEVNIDGERSKSGIAPEQAADFARALLPLDRLCIRGVMAMPAPQQSTADTLASFQRAADCFHHLQQQFPQLPLDTLSMGMSSDLELAIQAGSTMVRVGTDIFGAR